MLCMRCRKVVDTTYFVSKENAEGTAIKGPLVCQPCFLETFPSKPLPRPTYIQPPPALGPILLGSPLLVSEPSLIGRPFVPPPRQQSRQLSLDEALQFIADSNLINIVGFTWGPKKYNDAWAESIRVNDVITYALSIPKDCEQGLGVYLAENIWKSCSYGNTDDTSLLMVVCTGTPMLDYSTKRTKDALALRVAELSGVTMDGTELTVYLSQKACTVRAIKKYGNYFALTTGRGVVTTYDGARIGPYVSAQHRQIVASSSYPHAKAYLEKLFPKK